MEEMVRVLQNESSTLVAPAVDTSGGVTLEAMQTLEEVASEAAVVMTEGDDSVFYSEDEEVPQQIFSPICAQQSVGLFEPLEPVPQMYPSGAEESVLMGAGFVHHTVSMQKDVESLMKNKVNHVSSSATVQELESEMEGLSKTSPALNEEILKPSTMQYIMSTTAEAAPLPVQDKKPMDKNLLINTATEKPKELQSVARERDTVGTDESIATTERQDEETEEPDQSNESLDNKTIKKYGTVSYRRIRRGLTRQRIEEFEAMMQL